LQKDFKKAGKNINIEHGVYFASGRDIEIGTTPDWDLIAG